MQASSLHVVCEFADNPRRLRDLCRTRFPPLPKGGILSQLLGTNGEKVGALGVVLAHTPKVRQTSPFLAKPPPTFANVPLTGLHPPRISAFLNTSGNDKMARFIVGRMTL